MFLSWMLLFLYFGIFFFFVVVQLIVVGLLFDGFHESWGAPVYLWWLGRTTPGRTTVIGIWMTVAVRVVFLVYAFLAPSQTSSPSNGKQMDAGTLSLSPRLSVWDNALLAAVHITLLRPSTGLPQIISSHQTLNNHGIPLPVHPSA